MQIVLLASDGSAHADRAVAYLIGQIQQGGLLSDACAVHLLNVQPHLPSRISQGMSAEHLAANPLEGAVMMVELDVAGMREEAFAG